MDPAHEVALAESALREAIRSALPRWQAAPGAPNAEDLNRKRDEDGKRRDGTVVADDLLAYAETYHLADLITKNWERFKPVFDDKKRTEVFLNVLLDYRNPVAHSRELVGFERDLLSGVSGQIRNQVMLFRTRNEASRQHYPVIESVTDGFGQKLESTDNGYIWAREHEIVRLDVGERLLFRCTGWDSQERPLTWRLRVGKGTNATLDRHVLSLAGRNITFSVTAGTEWVGESISVAISLSSPGPYHRHKRQDYKHYGEIQYDDEVYGFYAVNPPRT